MWEMFLAHVVKLNPPPFSPRSPLFLGRPGGRGGHDGTPIVLWITWPDSIFLDGRSLPDSLVLHLGNLGDHLGFTWVSPDHLGFT